MTYFLGRISASLTAAMAKATAGDIIKSKAKCCKDRPRCKKCPVVCKRLETAGYLERKDKRHWVVVELAPKKTLKAARAGKPVPRAKVAA